MILKIEKITVCRLKKNIPKMKLCRLKRKGGIEGVAFMILVFVYSNIVFFVHLSHEGSTEYKEGEGGFEYVIYRSQHYNLNH